MRSLISLNAFLTIPFFIFLCCCVPDEIILYGDINGVVTNFETNHPFQSVSVELTQSEKTINNATTGSDGTYGFRNIDAGSYEISADYYTYKKITKKVVVEPAQTTKIDFILKKQPFPGFSDSFLDFGFDSTKRTFSISNIGKGELRYSVTAPQSWISVAPSSGTVNTEQDTILVTIDRTGFSGMKRMGIITVISYMEDGIRTDTIDVFANGIVDQDGNYYGIVTIGTQTWMNENLNTGEYILSGKGKPQDNDTVEKYCGYDSKIFCDIYGGIYYWDEMMGYAPADNGTIGITQGICPDGWHIPTLKEWETLIDFLGGPVAAVGKLQSTSTYWLRNPDIVPTNESGFSLLPGPYFNTQNFMGSAGPEGTFEGRVASIWSASVPYLFFYTSMENAVKFSGNFDAVSVRCIKDAE